MANLGFKVVDYSTGRRIRSSSVELLVPKSPSNTLRDRRMFYPVVTNLSGDLVVLDTPPGTYDVVVWARDYVTKKIPTVVSPMPSPQTLQLHRRATFQFSPEDTRVVGEVHNAVANLAPEDVTVQLVDPVPSVPNHTVPVYVTKAEFPQRWQFVVHVPEKLAASSATVIVTWPSGSKLTNIPTVELNRVTSIQPILIP